MTTDLKATARTAAFAARKAAHGDAATAVPLATAHLLRAVGSVPRGHIVAGYMPIRTEIDPLPAMAALHAAGAILCVPVIQGAGQPLLFHVWTPGCAMADGPFGAQIPTAQNPVTPDTLIMPLVGFDAALNRLGYGGGFYDRTLAQLRQTAQTPPRTIGFAYAAQQLPHVPQEETDQPVDMIVTEAGVHKRTNPLAVPPAAP